MNGRRIEIRASPLAGLLGLSRERRGDERGFFSRFFCADELASAGFDSSVAQVNHSCTAQRGSVRGMHLQRPPHAEVKIVSCIRGSVFDVAVDLRKRSPTFLQWHGEVLSASNMRSLLIPRGFAHGFQTLEDGCELIYLHSHQHAPASEWGCGPNDPLLAIRWPLPLAHLSPRDRSFAPLDSSFDGFDLS
jgi:dTDP-4-dehydrorhamnose 3,5-epimerase